MEYPSFDKCYSKRKEAKAAGEAYYYTGKPCIRGHIDLRETKGQCVVCRKEDWQRDNEKRKLKPKTEASKAAGRRYYLRNMELVKARAQARPTEEKQRHRNNHKKANPEVYKVLVNSRRRRLKDATPACQTIEDRKKIREIYATALRMKELTGIKYEVDHQIPIVSDTVCGLHVPWNLEILTETDNLKKSNTY